MCRRGRQGNNIQKRSKPNPQVASMQIPSQLLRTTVKITFCRQFMDERSICFLYFDDVKVALRLVRSSVLFFEVPIMAR